MVYKKEIRKKERNSRILLTNSTQVFGNGLFEKSHGRPKSLAGRNVFWKVREEHLSALYNLSVWKVATVTEVATSFSCEVCCGNLISFKDRKI